MPRKPYNPPPFSRSRMVKDLRQAQPAPAWVPILILIIIILAILLSRSPSL